MKLETKAFHHQMNTPKTWSSTTAPVRNPYVLLNYSIVSSFFRRVLDTLKHDGFFSNLKLKHNIIKGEHPNVMKLKTKAFGHKKKTSKTWSRALAPVRKNIKLFKTYSCKSLSKNPSEGLLSKNFNFYLHLNLIKPSFSIAPLVII